MNIEKLNVSELNVKPSGLPSLVDLSTIPALLDVAGINRWICPMSRSLAYSLASSDEVETVSLGMGRGKRLWVTATVVAWVQRRMAQTTRPNIASRQDNRTSSKDERCK